MCEVLSLLNVKMALCVLFGILNQDYLTNLRGEIKKNHTHNTTLCNKKSCTGILYICPLVWSEVQHFSKIICTKATSCSPFQPPALTNKK